MLALVAERPDQFCMAIGIDCGAADLRIAVEELDRSLTRVRVDTRRNLDVFARQCLQCDSDRRLGLVGREYLSGMWGR